MKKVLLILVLITVFLNCEKIEFKQTGTMAQQTINIGSSYDDLSADKERDAFDKVNDNFNEIYDVVMKYDVVPITGWDMDANASKDVSWALPADMRVVRMTVVIIPDANSVASYDFAGQGGTIVYDGSTKFTLTRPGSGTFDSTDFNYSGITRGYIYVNYADEDIS